MSICKALVVHQCTLHVVACRLEYCVTPMSVDVSVLNRGPPCCHCNRSMCISGQRYDHPVTVSAARTPSDDNIYVIFCTLAKFLHPCKQEEE